MNTEITDTAVASVAGWVFYDGECPLCLRAMERFGPMLMRRGFRLAPLQSAWARRCLDLNPDAPLSEMKVLLADSTVLGGADALVAIARRMCWGWPLFLFAKIPGTLPLLRAAYVQLAANRNCFKGHCAMRPRGAWWPLALLPTAALLFRSEMPGWILMWTLTFAIFFGCKWLTWRRAGGGSNWKTLVYLFAWPGMDAEAFLRGRKMGAEVQKPKVANWAWAIAKLAAGAGLVLVAATGLLGLGPLATGWVGIVGVVITLHFGIGELVSLAWRRVGMNCTPLMRGPLGATSLADFWGKRWNTAFNRLATEFVFKPLARGHGVVVGTSGAFLVSGLVHELVISVPARGGFGLPAAYFLVQGVGMLVERSAMGRRFGLGRGLGGRLFAAAVLMLPLGWLCPPIFIERVILPMLRALGGN